MADAMQAPSAASSVATNAVLQVRDLNAWYGESHVLHGINFEVSAGETITLIGRNGAGKSTTLKSIMGIVPTRKGSVMLQGQEAINLPSRTIARLGVGYVPEERGIYAKLSVEENLFLRPQVRPANISTAQIFELFPNLRER